MNECKVCGEAIEAEESEYGYIGSSPEVCEGCQSDMTEKQLKEKGRGSNLLTQNERSPSGRIFDL